MAGQQRGIQTVDLSGEILHLICGSPKSLSLSEIAEALGLAPGSAYKYLISLQRTGLLKRNESTLEFEAGALSLRLGIAKINHNEVVAQSRQLLTQIAEKHEVNVFTSLWSDLNGPTVVFYKEFAGFFNLGFRLGNKMALSTATGRLFAAYKSVQAEENLSLQKAFQQEHEQFLNADFQRGLADIRALGYSALIDTPTPGISSYAVPVFNAAGQISFAITAFAKTQYLSPEKIQQILAELKAAARDLQENSHA